MVFMDYPVSGHSLFPLCRLTITLNITDSFILRKVAAFLKKPDDKT